MNNYVKNGNVDNVTALSLKADAIPIPQMRKRLTLYPESPSIVAYL
jgi:hypothetical protein